MGMGGRGVLNLREAADWWRFLAVALLVAVPVTAFADPVTALVIPGTLHMLFGNALLGVIEGLILANFFRASRWRCVLLLIVANYLSAWLGGLWIVGYLVYLIDITIETVRIWFWLFVLLAFVVTLILEFPFFLFALRNTKNALKRAAKSTLSINAFSYLLVVAFYWPVGDASMLTRLKVVSAVDMRTPQGHDLYFISPDGRQVVRADLAGNRTERIKSLVPSDRRDLLDARRGEEGQFDLYVMFASACDGEEPEALVLKGFASRASGEEAIPASPGPGNAIPWFTGLGVAELARTGDWWFRTGYLASRGIGGRSAKADKRFR